MPSQTHRTGEAPRVPPGRTGPTYADVDPPKTLSDAENAAAAEASSHGRDGLEEPVDEGLGARAAGRHVGTCGGEQGVGVAAVAAVGLGTSVLEPVADHRLGRLGV